MGIDYSKWDNLNESDSEAEEEDGSEDEEKGSAVIMHGAEATELPVPVKDAPADDKDLQNQEQDASRRQYLNRMNEMEQQYRSQHCGAGDDIYSEINRALDAIGPEGVVGMAPSYKSGINPNFFEEYFSELQQSDFTNTAECKKTIWDEYQSRRWSYAMHLAGYHNGLTQKDNRKAGKVEFWRRFHIRQRPTPPIFEWYFSNQRKIGDVLRMPPAEYIGVLSDVLSASFANCPVSPKQKLTFGSVHVAVGFVDLGLLLDSNFLLERETEEPSACLLFRGFEASSFSVAKSVVLWEMLCTIGTKASWVVQVWFSTIWSRRATNAFLAAARRVAAAECSCVTVDYPQGVCLLVQHWALSKGVGLKKLARRRGQTRNETSDALFFARKEDRVEMIRYHLTGAFGLAGEEPCSGSVLMFDCHKATKKLEAASVFETLTLDDVISSEFFNGSYFQTAEKVKETRVLALLEYAQAGQIKVQLSVAALNLKSAALEEITRLQPHSISWSNILDYMSREQFHTLAKACSSTAVHSGYSMNWPRAIYGSSLIDYPATSLEVITEAEKATVTSLRDLCRNRLIFLTPIQHNPLNITAGFLAKRCHSHWLQHFFGEAKVRICEAGMMDSLGNPLSRVPVVVSSSWTYE